MLVAEVLLREISSYKQKWYGLFTTLNSTLWSSELEELINRFSYGFQVESDALNQRINAFYQKYAGNCKLGDEFPPVRSAYNEAYYGILNIIPLESRSR